MSEKALLDSEVLNEPSDDIEESEENHEYDERTIQKIRKTIKADLTSSSDEIDEESDSDDDSDDEEKELQKGAIPEMISQAVEGFDVFEDFKEFPIIKLFSKQLVNIYYTALMCIYWLINTFQTIIFMNSHKTNKLMHSHEEIYKDAAAYFLFEKREALKLKKVEDTPFSLAIVQTVTDVTASIELPGVNLDGIMGWKPSQPERAQKYIPETLVSPEREEIFEDN